MEGQRRGSGIEVTDILKEVCSKIEVPQIEISSNRYTKSLSDAKGNEKG